MVALIDIATNALKGKLNEVFIFYSQVSYQTWHKRIRIGGSIYIYSTKYYKHTIFIHQTSSMVSLVIKPYLIFTILFSKPKFPCPRQDKNMSIQMSTIIRYTHAIVLFPFSSILASPNLPKSFSQKCFSHPYLVKKTQSTYIQPKS